MAKILSICGDESLRTSREMILRKSGAEVFSADLAAGMQLLDSQRFDLLVTGHTLAMADVLRLADAFRLHSPGGKILYLGAPAPEQSRANIPFDSSIDWVEGPDAFLRAVRRLLRQAAGHLPANPARENTSLPNQTSMKTNLPLPGQA